MVIHFWGSAKQIIFLKKLFFDKAPSGSYRIGTSGHKKNYNIFGIRTLELTIKVKKISIFIKRVIYKEVHFYKVFADFYLFNIKRFWVRFDVRLSGQFFDRLFAKVFARFYARFFVRLIKMGNVEQNSQRVHELYVNYSVF